MDEVLKLKGKAADAFLEYDSKKISKNEQESNKHMNTI